MLAITNRCLQHLIRRHGSASVSRRSCSLAVKDFMDTRTMVLQQGEKCPHGGVFSEAELNGRVTKLRQYMVENGMSACLFTSHHNICYYSGFLQCSFGRPYGLVISPEKHCTVSALIDYSSSWRSSLQDNLIYTDWKKDNYFWAVNQLLKDIKGPVGVEFDHMTLERFKKLQQSLASQNELVDISEAIMRMRMTKSQEEIAVITNGAMTADLGGEAIRDVLHEGISEYEVALVGTEAMVKNIAKLYPKSDIRDTWVWFQSGINTDGAHNPVTKRCIKKGDILSMNCFPMIYGYYTALERTMFLDYASDEHLRLWEANVAVHRRGLEVIKPGVRCCDIASELNEMFAELGLLKYRTFGYGHSFGVLCHYYGREAGLELREDNETVLQPGNVISMEPMITIPMSQPGGGGYREHDIIVLHYDGTIENITKFPFGPEHCIIKN